MDKVKTKGILKTQPSFSFMQNATTGMAICKGYMLNQNNVLPLICFDDLAYFMRNNFKSEDKVEVLGYFKNYKPKFRERGLDKIFVVTELVDKSGNVLRNEADIEERACEEMVEKGFPLVDILTNYAM